MNTESYKSSGNPSLLNTKCWKEVEGEIWPVFHRPMKLSVLLLIFSFLSAILKLAESTKHGENNLRVRRAVFDLMPEDRGRHMMMGNMVRRKLSLRSEILQRKEKQRKKRQKLRVLFNHWMRRKHQRMQFHYFG